MLIKLLLFLKKHYAFLWRTIELFNGILFRFLYNKKLMENTRIVLEEFKNEPYHYRLLESTDLELLILLIQNQDQKQFEFFKPHAFDKRTLIRLYKNPAFFMFGVFDKKLLIGYFFLRCFMNKKCFTGRLVDEKYQGQGIAKRMGKILHTIAWSSNFRVFGTASKNNIKSLTSYKAINDFVILKELDNDFILFEYLKSNEKPI